MDGRNHPRTAATPLSTGLRTTWTPSRIIPVMPGIKPGDIKKQLPNSPPEQPEAFESLLRDFNDTIVPGMTHWQHPSFLRLFPGQYERAFDLCGIPHRCAGGPVHGLANLSRGYGAGRGRHGLAERHDRAPRTFFRRHPGHRPRRPPFAGCFPPRERATDYRINRSGFHDGCKKKLTVYTSEEGPFLHRKGREDLGDRRGQHPTHPHGREFLHDPRRTRKERFTKTWKRAISHVSPARDPRAATSSTAMDPVRAIGEICKKHGIWLHVDAAMAGTAALLPEMRGFMDGVELVDSFVFNPHKWMFTQLRLLRLFSARMPTP